MPIYSLCCMLLFGGGRRDKQYFISVLSFSFKVILGKKWKLPGHTSHTPSFSWLYFPGTCNVERKHGGQPCTSQQLHGDQWFPLWRTARRARGGKSLAELSQRAVCVCSCVLALIVSLCVYLADRSLIHQVQKHVQKTGLPSKAKPTRVLLCDCE